MGSFVHLLLILTLSLCAGFSLISDQLPQCSVSNSSHRMAHFNSKFAIYRVSGYFKVNIEDNLEM